MIPSKFSNAYFQEYISFSDICHRASRFENRLDACAIAQGAVFPSGVNQALYTRVTGRADKTAEKRGKSAIIPCWGKGGRGVCGARSARGRGAPYKGAIGGGAGGAAMRRRCILLTDTTARRTCAILRGAARSVLPTTAIRQGRPSCRIPTDGPEGCGRCSSTGPCSRERRALCTPR